MNPNKKTIIQDKRVTKSWVRGFSIARAASLHSDGKRPGRKMGAALLSGSSVISVGFNLYSKSSPLSCPDGIDRKIHAEMAVAIRRRHYDNPNNMIVYVWRETAAGTPAHSKPCSHCVIVLKAIGVKKARYIDEKGHYKEMKIN